MGDPSRIDAPGVIAHVERSDMTYQRSKAVRFVVDERKMVRLWAMGCEEKRSRAMLRRTIWTVTVGSGRQAQQGSWWSAAR